MFLRIGSFMSSSAATGEGSSSVTYTTPQGQALVLVIGDSIPSGYGIASGSNNAAAAFSGNVTDVLAYPNVFLNSYKGRLSYAQNVALSGVDISWATDAGVQSNAASWLTAKKSRNGTSKKIAYIHLGRNGPVGGVSYGASATLADLSSAASYWKGLGYAVVLGTLLPDGATAGFEAFRTTVNAGIRAMVGGAIDAVADFDTEATMGLLATASNATYFQADKVHPTAAGHALLEPIFRRSISSLITPTAAVSAYPAWDATYKDAAVTLTGSNYIASGGSGFKGTRSTTWRDGGKYYAEIKATTSLDLMVGVIDACTNANEYLGQSPRGLGAWLNNGMFADSFTAVNAPTMTGGSTGGTVARIAIDFDAGKVWMTRDGNAWPGSGDPTTGANPSYTFDANSRLYLAYSGNNAAAVATLPTGSGNLAYSIPSGFAAF